jgi:hypothetical protein
MSNKKRRDNGDKGDEVQKQSEVASADFSLRTVEEDLFQLARWLKYPRCSAHGRRSHGWYGVDFRLRTTPILESAVKRHDNF